MAAPEHTHDAALLARVCGGGDGPCPATMLVLAHPDDETVGAATLLPQLTLGTFVYVTTGSPANLRDAHAAGCTTAAAYANLRRGEALSALDSIGVPPARVEWVDVVDQEVSFQLAAVARWLEILIREHRPALVLTHPYEGGHPDHDGVAFAVHAACHQIAAAGDVPPVRAEFTSYHRADGSWRFGEFLAADNSEVLTRRLTPAQRTLKRQLIGCYPSQRRVLEHVPLDTERFRLAPDYDFTQPPHSGRLLYEDFSWGMTGAEWRRLAAEARHHLETHAAFGART